MDWLTGPLEYGFFRHGLVVAVAAGALCGLIGTFVVLRGMSYLGHGLSHSVFGAAAVGSAVGANYYATAGVWSVATAVIIGRISRHRVLRPDAVIGVVTTASFAVGVATLARWGQARRSLDAVLFGSILGVSTTDVIVVVVLATGTALVVAARYRDLLFTAFDPEVARVAGVPTGRLDDLLMVLLGLAVLGTMQVVGAVLVSAMLVIPAATARLLTHRFGFMLVGSTAFGALAGGTGLMTAYHLDVPSGAAITLVAAAGFVAAALASRLRP